MNEQDLEQATEIYRTRRFVENSLATVIATKTLGLEHAGLNLTFLRKDERGQNHGHADLDASLRAFGCEPPTPAPTPAVRGPTRTGRMISDG